MKTIKTPEEIINESNYLINGKDHGFYGGLQLVTKGRCIELMKAYAAQLELTDEEIDKQADLKFDTFYTKGLWIGGAKWYRSQLKEMQK